MATRHSWTACWDSVEKWLGTWPTDGRTAAINPYGGKIKVRGRLRGKSRSRGPVWGLQVLVCARVLPGQLPYQRQWNRSVIHGKEKVYGSIP
jgi:hypothetical protein